MLISNRLFQVLLGVLWVINALGMEMPQAQTLLEALKKNDVNELRALIRKGEKIQKWQLPSLLALPKESWVESMPLLMTECPIEIEQEIDKGVKSLKELVKNFILKNKISPSPKNIPNEVLLLIMKQADQDCPDHLKILQQMMEDGRSNKNNNICSVATNLVNTVTIPKAKELILMMAEYVPAEQKQLLFGPASKNIRVDWCTCLVSELISKLVNRQVAIRKCYIDEFKVVNQRATQIIDRKIREPDFIIQQRAFIPKINDSAYNAVKESSSTCHQFCLNNLLAKIKR